MGLAGQILTFAWSKNPALRLSLWTATFCELRWSGSIAFGLWFWFHGLDAVNSAQCMEPQVCIYACTGAYGNIRSLMKAIYILAAIGEFIVWIRWIMFFIHCAFYRTGSFEERWSIRQPLEDLHTGNQRRSEFEESGRLRWLESLVIFVLLAFMLLSVILGIELEIKHNNLDGVQGIDTTGQIVPLAVGCFSMGRAIALVVMWSFGILKTDIETSPDLETASEFPPVRPSKAPAMPPLKHPNVYVARGRQSKQKTDIKEKRHDESEPWTKRSVRRGKPLPPAQASKDIFK